MSSLNLFLTSLIVLLAGSSLFFLLRLLFRSVARQPAARNRERQKISEYVARYGRTPMDQFLLQPGRSYWFSPHGSVVGYISYAQNVVGLGDPVGPAEDLAGAIVGFRDYCHARGWQPAFYQIRPVNINHYQAAGFGTAPLEQEPLPLYAQLTLPAGDATRVEPDPIYYIAFPSPESLPAIQQAVRRAQSKPTPWQQLWHGLAHWSQRDEPRFAVDLNSVEDDPRR